MWAMKNLSKSGQKIFIAEPGTWWEVKQSEIHACISLSPSAHAAQEFFYVNNAQEILKVWRVTEEAWKNTKEVVTFEADDCLKLFAQWLPQIPENQQNLDPMLQNAIDLYKYVWEMVMEGKSGQVTQVSEVCSMLPLVCIWIERHIDCQ